MGTVKRVLAVFLAVMAGAVALHLIFTPVYHNGSEDYTLWEIMNWFMAPAALIVLVVGFQRRRALNSEASALDQVRTSAAYYGGIVLAMLFFWGWFWVLNPSSETGNAAASHSIYFPIVDALFVVLTLSTGRHLWSSVELPDAIARAVQAVRGRVGKQQEQEEKAPAAARPRARRQAGGGAAGGEADKPTDDTAAS